VRVYDYFKLTHHNVITSHSIVLYSSIYIAPLNSHRQAEYEQMITSYYRSWI